MTLHALAGMPTRDATNAFRMYRTSLLREIAIECLPLCRRQQAQIKVDGRCGAAQFAHLILCFVERLVNVQNRPGIALGDLPLEHDAMIDRVETRLFVVAHAFLRGILEQGANLGAVAEIHPAPVDEVGIVQVQKGGVDPSRKQHRPDILALGNPLDPDAGRRCEPGRACVTQHVGALHVPVDVRRHDTEFVVERAAAPQRSGLLILGNRHLLALQVFRLLDAAVGSNEDLGVKEAA